MEELVGHRLEARDGGVVGVDPDGGAVRLRRLPPAEADRLAAVLEAAAGEHVEAILDVATAVNGDVVLVLPHLPTPLADLLPIGLTAGEAVTVLVPLVGAVQRLHAAGITHGALGVAAVRFDERGAPMLTGFDAGTLRSDVGDAAFRTAASADETAFRALASAVLRAAGPRAAGLVDELGAGTLALAALVDALFALADPAPVRLGPRPRADLPVEPPGRLVAPADPRASAPAEVGRSSPVAVLGRRLGRAATTGLALLRGVRLRVWLAAGASLALLAGALVLLPGRGAASEPEPARTTAVPAPPSTARATPKASSTPVSVPADPLAAARVLLAERRRCLAALSVRCLARIESAGSPVAVVDAAAVAGALEPVQVPGTVVRLRSRSGGTAVLTVADRTVLLLEERAGWRLRDVIGPPTRRSTARSSEDGD